MKRDRAGTEAPPSVPLPPSQAPILPPPASDGALKNGRSSTTPSNGNGVRAMMSRPSITNGGASASAAAEAAPPKRAKMGTAGGRDEGGGGAGQASATGKPLQSLLHASIPSSATGSVASSSSSASSGKRPKSMIVEEPEGWRNVAEEVIRTATLRKEDFAAAPKLWEDGELAGREKRSGGEEGNGLPAPTSRRMFSVVCSANFNRSMMAHKLLRDHRFRVESYGTGRDVRLPGKDHMSPEIFPFGTRYMDIYDALKSKDEELFRRNNLLGLVARNASIKTAPQRFQDIGGVEMAGFDVVLCFDSRVFYLVVEDLVSRDPETFRPLHVVNMTIKDSPEESAAAAGDVLNLCKTLDGLPSLEEQAARALEAFAKKTKRMILHQVCHV